MKKIKILCFVILMTFALTLILPSCGNTGDNNPQESNQNNNNANENPDDLQNSQTGQEDMNSRANYKDSLPDNLDFDKMEYRVLVREDDEYNFEFVDSEIGEIVNDALYKRQQLVEERLNIKIVPTKRFGNWDRQSQFLTPMKASIAAGSDDFDVIAGYAYYITPFALDGNFLNLAQFPNIDYEKPWWPDSITSNLKIANKLYFISGDYSLTMIRSLNCFFFNKTIAQGNDLPNLYQIVLDGDWTFDRFAEISKNVSQDLNGDGKFDTNDLYGLVSRWYDIYFPAFQLPISTTDPDGTLNLAIYNDKFVSAYEKIYELTHDVSSLHVKYINADVSLERTMFVNDQVLFLGRNLEMCDYFRDMDSPYGILPYPKYDKSQDKYYTVTHDDYSLLCVPTTVDPAKLEMIGAATEALAAEGYRSVTPAYFEIALKNKYSRDDESSQMLDILVDGNTFEPAIIYSGSLGNIGHLIREMQNDTPDITSIYQKKEKAYQNAFNKFNEKFAELN